MVGPQRRRPEGRPSFQRRKTWLLSRGANPPRIHPQVWRLPWLCQPLSPGLCLQQRPVHHELHIRLTNSPAPHDSLAVGHHEKGLAECLRWRAMLCCDSNMYCNTCSYPRGLLSLTCPARATIRGFRRSAAACMLVCMGIQSTRCLAGLLEAAPEAAAAAWNAGTVCWRREAAAAAAAAMLVRSLSTGSTTPLATACSSCNNSVVSKAVAD